MKSEFVGKDLSDSIRKKAYELWEKDGHKKGCDIHYWLKAEKAVKAQIKR